MNKLLIIGGGNMGYAIAEGISSKGFLKKESISFIEKDLKRINFLKKKKFKIISSYKDLNINDIETILIAVKPKDIHDLLNDLKKYIFQDTLILSIAAGIKIKKISSILKKNPIGRIMPNTPCQIRKGISVITFSKNCKNSHKIITKNIFSSIGEVIELPENKLDIVTAISGSGPAYFAYLIEALTISGSKLGLDKKNSYALSLATGLGTLQMLNEINDLTAEKLREMVTSPNGTTHAAITSLQKNNFSNIIYRAIKSAKNRSIEMGK